MSTTSYRPLGGQTRNYQLLMPILIVAVVIAVTVTVSVVAGTTGRKTLRTIDELAPAPTTTAVTTTTTTTIPTTTPAPPSTIRSCANVNRMISSFNNSVILPQNATFLWNLLPGMLTQTFLNGDLIVVDPVVSAVRFGDRFLVSELNSERLTALMLDGTVIQDIFAWSFTNVYGMIASAGKLYVLTDTDELLRMDVGETFAFIELRVAMPFPSRYITIDPNTLQPFVLLQNGTIATLNLSNASVASVCTPSETGYHNIGFDSMGNLVGTMPFVVDTITL